MPLFGRRKPDPDFSRSNSRIRQGENSLGRSSIQTNFIPVHMSEWDVYSNIWNQLIDDFFARTPIEDSLESTTAVLWNLNRHIRASIRKGDIETIIVKILNEHPQVVALREQNASWRARPVNTVVETTRSKVELSQFRVAPPVRSPRANPPKNIVSRVMRAFQSVMP